MVGKVTVRGQGPVRRRQTTTTFKKGGRVKLMGGGKPSARTRHIENEKEEIRRVDRNIRRNEGYKTGGKVKKNMGGLIKKVRSYVGDVTDAKKKLSPHQDPKSKRSAQIRHMMDNPKKPSKKSPSPHSPNKKKRTLKDAVRPGGMKKMMPKMGGAGKVAKKKK